jgi:biotin transport system substrate-specific component
MSGGLGIILGPRGGYLIGFVLTDFLVGHFFEKYKDLSLLSRFFTILSVYSVLIYGLGCLHLAFWLWFVKGAMPSLYSVLMMGMIPFIVGDICKILAVALISRKF